jgi:hypothetical protein
VIGLAQPPVPPRGRVGWPVYREAPLDAGGFFALSGAIGRQQRFRPVDGSAETLCGRFSGRGLLATTAFGWNGGLLTGPWDRPVDAEGTRGQPRSLSTCRRKPLPSVLGPERRRTHRVCWRARPLEPQSASRPSRSLSADAMSHRCTSTRNQRLLGRFERLPGVALANEARWQALDRVDPDLVIAFRASVRACRNAIRNWF